MEISYSDWPECRTIIHKYRVNLPVIGWFIDDIFSVIDFNTNNNENTNSHTFEDFDKEINNKTSLTWTVEGPTKTLNFMDLNISIRNNKSTHSKKAYQK